MRNRVLMGAMLATLTLFFGVFCYIYSVKDPLNDYEAQVATERLFNAHKLFNRDLTLPEIEVEEKESEEYHIPTTGDLRWGMTEDELNLVYAVVMQEGGPSFESATYVMSTIVNRVNNPGKWSWAGDTIIDQITYPMQYCYSLDDYWVKYLDGNVPETVKEGVQSVLESGPVHDYDCFRGFYIEGCEQCSDNWYFVG